MHQIFIESAPGSFISSFTHWDKRAGLYGDRLAREMGCPGDGFANGQELEVSRRVVECLQNISDPLEFAGKTKLFLHYPWTGPNIWKPIVDGHFAKEPVNPIESVGSTNLRASAKIFNSSSLRSRLIIH